MIHKLSRKINLTKIDPTLHAYESCDVAVEGNNGESFEEVQKALEEDTNFMVAYYENLASLEKSKQTLFGPSNPSPAPAPYSPGAVKKYHPVNNQSRQTNYPRPRSRPAPVQRFEGEEGGECPPDLQPE